MMRGDHRVVVTGVGLISPLGDSPTSLYEALVAGTGALGPVDLFSTDGLPCAIAGEVRGFEPKKYLSQRNLRPLDRTSRLAAGAAELALKQSGWGPEERGERQVGLVLGTLFGSVHTISEFDRRALTAGPNYAKPMDFANSVINAAAGQTAIWHDLWGINTTLSGGPTAGVQALAYAADLIRSGRSEAVLAGGADELCFESFLGFARTGRLCGGGGEPRPIPFDARRDGLALAEGGALLMLEDAGSALGRGAHILAEVRGHGSAFDLSHGRDATRAADAVARAVTIALESAELTANELDAVSASASGSPAGDRCEAHGLAAALGEAASRIPVTAVKAALGEALGASGAFQAIALLGAMEHGVLPGIRGLEETGEGFPLAGATAEPHPVPELRRGLVTALGLDGNAVAVVLERWEGAARGVRTP